jgi:N-acetylmuramic acid 6-phosphate etherase
VTNEKLRDRAARIVEQAAGASREQAVAALDEAGEDAKVAIAMLRAGLDADAARATLEAAGGHLRRALGE